MPHIAIISSSIRVNRQSHRVALFLQNYIIQNNKASCDILDLLKYNFPVFTERFKYQNNPEAQTTEFAKKIVQADGIIIVTPEYNGGYPASLKNVTDLLYAEWFHKPVAISTVSDGVFGGSQVITSLQFALWKMKAWTVPAMLPVPKVHEAFDENGKPADETGWNKRAEGFIKELLWCMEANSLMNSKNQ